MNNVNIRPLEGLYTGSRPRPHDNRALDGHNELFRNLIIHYRASTSNLYTFNESCVHRFNCRRNNRPNDDTPLTASSGEISLAGAFER